MSTLDIICATRLWRGCVYSVSWQRAPEASEIIEQTHGGSRHWRHQHLPTFTQWEKQTASIVSSWEMTIELCYDGRSSTMSSSVPRLPRLNLSTQDTVPLSCWNEHCRNWAIYICATLWLWTDYATAKHALHNRLCTPLPYTRCSQTERLKPPPPPASELASNQICYVPPTPNSSLRCDLYLFLFCTDVHYDTDVIQWLDEINGVYTHIRKQLLGGMCLFSVHRVILNDW